MIVKILLYVHTIKFLKYSQIFWRLFYLVFRHPRLTLRKSAPQIPGVLWSNHITIEPYLSVVNKCCFLNVSADISDQKIWNDTSFSKLWLYNLHYFDDLVGADYEKRLEWHRKLISRWIKENPVGVGIGWEPYPTSRRIVNWIKWILSAHQSTPDMTKSLFLQSSWLDKRVEFHILGNHLISNAKALIFAGLFFDLGSRTAWFAKGLRILEKQIDEQILDDGGHFELSPMYHLIVLVDLLDVVQVLRCYQRRVPRWLSAAVERMLGWAAVMQHPDGEIPFFNDCSFNVAPNPKCVEEYGLSLGFPTNSYKACDYQFLKSSGYVQGRLKDALILIDLAKIGPDYLPGHGHADSLSFEMSLFKTRLFVNSGVSEYSASARRLVERSSMSHNTLSIDGLDSSEVWSSFRVARRAFVSAVSVKKKRGVLTVQGSHDGYKRIDPKLLHTRNWRLDHSKVEILDTVSGLGYHNIQVNFHVGPDWIPELTDEGHIKIFKANDPGKFCTLRVGDRLDIGLKTKSWAFQFGKRQKIWCISVDIAALLPVKILTKIDWA